MQRPLTDPRRGDVPAMGRNKRRLYSKAITFEPVYEILWCYHSLRQMKPHLLVLISTFTWYYLLGVQFYHLNLDVHHSNLVTRAFPLKNGIVLLFKGIALGTRLAPFK